MSKYKMTQAEKEYLSYYDIGKFPRPSVAADIVIFSILNDGVNNNKRKLQKRL